MKQTFWIWLTATIALMAILNWVSAPLVNDVAPYGLFSWQLAGTPQRAQSILNSWDERTRYLAAFGLGLDYLFMVVYTVTLSGACRWSAAKIGRPTLAKPLIALVWTAAVLDGVENAFLGIALIGGAVSPYPEGAAFSAAGKFALLFGAMGFVFVGLFVALLRRGNGK